MVELIFYALLFLVLAFAVGTLLGVLLQRRRPELGDRLEERGRRAGALVRDRMGRLRARDETSAPRAASAPMEATPELQPTTIKDFDAIAPTATPIIPDSEPADTQAVEDRPGSFPAEAETRPVQVASDPARAAPGASTDSGTADGTRPPALSAPRDGQADNLQQITGIGPANERRLNELGIYHFDQIAGWTPSQVEWVNASLRLRGRVEREDWVGQARALVQTTGAGMRGGSR